ncbi:plasmalemma vesicle-associated protein [Ambystoma mexicanum]|uniref:plasmalemma vesicle-associated protein n=1 Tax=Ambystoma mexicanum TaxID=8296 RepID=UPI0037E7DD0A
MDRSPYAMNKFGLESKDILHSRQKGCWSYLKYFFFFTSVIQSLIILGLVLFMVYGNPQASNESHLREMERSNVDMHGRLMHLNSEKQNLTRIINRTAVEFARYQQFYEKTRMEMRALNQSNQNYRNENLQMRMMMQKCQGAIATSTRMTQQMNTLNMTCQAEKLHLRMEKNHLEMDYIKAKENCTTSKSKLVQEAEDASKVRERYFLEMIKLREEKRTLADQLTNFKTTCSAIDGGFQAQMQQLQQKVSEAVKKALPSQSSSPFEMNPECNMQINQLNQNCKLLSAEITRQMLDEVKRINNLLPTYISENSLLKADQGKAQKDVEECERTKQSMVDEKKREIERMQAKCDSETTLIYNEKETLKREKMDLGKQVEEKKQSLQTAQMQLATKNRELERCIKIPHGSSPFNSPMGFPGGSQNLNDLNDQITKILN